MNEQQAEGHDVAFLREYVQEGKLMQVATVDSGGAPRIFHCWYAADEHLNLAFLSGVGRHHSKDIVADGRVAGGIIAIPLEGLGQKVRGIMFTGMAREVSGNDLASVYSTYSGRWPQVQREPKTSLDALINETSESRLWQIRPTSFILFDEVHFPGNARREIVKW